MNNCCIFSRDNLFRLELLCLCHIKIKSIMVISYSIYFKVIVQFHAKIINVTAHQYMFM